MHLIWDQPQDESYDNGIRECVETIRTNADESDPVRSPDLISFIYAFAYVLWGLVPGEVVQTHRDQIFEVMGDLAGFLIEPSGEDCLETREACVHTTRLYFYTIDLRDQNLLPRLAALEDTLRPTLSME